MRKAAERAAEEKGSTTNAPKHPPSKHPPPSNCPNPVYNMQDLERISELNQSISSISPSAALSLFKSTNTYNKRTLEHVEATYIIDVRMQAELQFHTIKGRAFTLIRGAIPFPLHLIEKLGKGGGHVPPSDVIPQLPEPMCDDSDCMRKTLLVSCTDGKRSYIAADMLLNGLGFADVRVISGGVRAWGAANLPLISHSTIEISSDEDSD